MFALGAVEPDWFRVVDHDGVGWDRGCSLGDGLEAGPESCDVGHDFVDWDAGLGEG